MTARTYREAVAIARRHTSTPTATDRHLLALAELSDACHSAARAATERETIVAYELTRAPALFADVLAGLAVEPVRVDVPRIDEVGAAVGVVVEEIGGHVDTMEPVASNVCGNLRESGHRTFPQGGE